MGTACNEEKKKFLWEYRNSIRRIKRIESEIEEIRAIKMGAALCNETGHNGWKSDLSGYMASLDERERSLEKEWNSRKQLYEEVERMINSLEDAREQDVLFYRYIKGLSWWEIAEQTGYTERHIHRFHGNALAHLDFPKDVIECQCQM